MSLLSIPYRLICTLVVAFLVVTPVAFATSAIALSSGVLKGIVVDGETHEPIERATVTVIELGTVVFTDSAGAFSVKGISQGTYRIGVTRLGYLQSVTNVFVTDSVVANEFFIHLFPMPINTGGVVITGEHEDAEIRQELETMHSMHGKQLQQEIGQTLASTLKNETGITVRSMGPAPARPVIRGLGGDRVQISEDGVKTNDLSATSPDHTVTVEPFTAERIEVVRGPKLLLNGSTTIGGMVNIIRNEIPEAVPSHTGGHAGIFFETANNGRLASSTLLAPLGNVAVRAEGSTKKTENLSTPFGELINSESKTQSYSLGGSYVDPSGFSGATFREFQTQYGIPGGFIGAHPKGVDIDMFKRQFTAKVQRNNVSDLFHHITFEAGRTYYHHSEYEKNGLVGASFSIVTYSGRLEAHHSQLGFMEEGAWGVSLEQRRFEVGGYVFTPATTSTNYSAFFFETGKLGEFTVELGGRACFDVITPDNENPVSAIGNIRARKFADFALSFAAIYELSPKFLLGGNISRSSRTPTLEELYSQGPHLAAYTYEVGNPNLETEHGFGLEMFSRYKTETIRWGVTFFMNNLSNYIITRNNGTLNYQTLLPVYAASGVSAIITGAETELTYDLGNSLNCSASLSYTYGELSDDALPLPAIPPMKNLIELQYSNDKLEAKLTVEISGPQQRTDLYEEPTAGYGILHAMAQYSLPYGALIHTVTVSMDNIFDKEYRNHLSRVKSIMPEAGRNVRLLYKVFF